MSEFDRLADERWARGVAAYRDDPSEPFKGDPVEEGCEELLDCRNYVNESERQGRISSEIAALIRTHLARAYWLLSTKRTKG